MADNWIIDVLADLKSYSASNALPMLEAQLAETLLIAAAEIASKECGRPETVASHAGSIGRLSGAHARNPGS